MGRTKTWPLLLTVSPPSPGLVHSFFRITTPSYSASDALHDEVDRRLVAPFLAEHVVRGVSGVKIINVNSPRQSLFWWRMILMPLLHSMGNPMLSEKALGMLRSLAALCFVDLLTCCLQQSAVRGRDSREARQRKE